MKKLIFAIVLVTLSAFSAFAQATCTRHTEPAGRLSYCPPAGWTAKDSTTPDNLYKTFLAPAGAAVGVANLNVMDELTSSSDGDYLVAVMKSLLADNEPKGEEAMKIIGWTEFVTTANLRGNRLVSVRLYKGVRIRQVQFIFGLPGRKLIFTASSLEANKAALDNLIDAAVRTLVVNP